MKNRIHLLPLIIGVLLTMLGHITINEFGGFDKATQYWWYWVGCLIIPIIVSGFIWDENQD